MPNLESRVAKLERVDQQEQLFIVCRRRIAGPEGVDSLLWETEDQAFAREGLDRSHLPPNAQVIFVNRAGALSPRLNDAGTRVHARTDATGCGNLFTE